MNVLYLLYFAVGGLITVGVVLFAVVFLLKKMELGNDRRRRAAEARAAVQAANDANRTFAPHG